MGLKDMLKTGAVAIGLMSEPPRFHLVAELLGDGTLICNPNLQKLLSKSEGLEIVIVSTVEDQILGKPRMIDHCQYTFFLEQKEHEKWHNYDIWKAWQKFPQKHFPRPGTESAPAELQGKNGILMKSKPYIGTSNGQRHCGLPLNKAVFLMTIWIGAPEYLDDAGFTKLADFLYFASSSVIHATFNPDHDQFLCTKRFLWYSSISNAYQEHAKVFKQICFLFFNWPYDEKNTDLKLFGHIKASDFKKWGEFSPIVAACTQVSQRFHSPSFYCFNALGQKGLDVRALKNILATEANGFQVRREWLSTKLRQDEKFEDLVQKIAHQLNQHFYSPADPLWVPPVPARSPQRLAQATSTLYLQTEKRQGGTTRATYASKAQAQRATELTVAIGKYQQYFEKLFMENPTTDLVKLGEFHTFAATQVSEDVNLDVNGTDIIIRALQKEWANLTECLGRFELELADCESKFCLLLMTPGANHQNLLDCLETARRHMQDFCRVHYIRHKNVLNHFSSMHGEPALEKMKSIIETLSAFGKAVKQAHGYVQDKTITEAHQGAVVKFQDPDSSLDLMAVFALDNMLNITEIQNKCLQQKAVILASEARQSALTEYQKSMDYLLEKAVYSRQSLLETHEQVIEAIVGTFSCEHFQNEIWQDMSKALQDEMTSQFPTVLEKNYVNAKAAYGRYKEVVSFAFKTYTESLGSDYDQLLGRKKQRAHDDARRAALAAYREKVTGEPQAWITQWYQDLYNRIGEESPDAKQTSVASVTNSTSAPAKQPLPAPVETLKSKENAPAGPSPVLAAEDPATLISPKVAANFNSNLEVAVVAIAVNSNDVTVSSRYGHVVMPFVQQTEVDHELASWTLQDFLNKPNTEAEENSCCSILLQWFSSIEYQVKTQWNVQASSWIICVDAGITCAGKRRLYNALTSSGYGNFRIVYKCAMMALSHYFTCFKETSGQLTNHEVMVVRLLANGDHNVAKVRVSTEGIEMKSLFHVAEQELLRNLVTTALSHRHLSWPGVKIIFSSEMSSCEPMNQEYYDVLTSCLKSKDVAVQGALIQQIDSRDVSVQACKYAEILDQSSTSPSVIEVSPYDLILAMPDKSVALVKLHDPTTKQIVVTQSWPNLDVEIVITEKRYDRTMLQVTTMLIKKEKMRLQIRTSRGKAAQINFHVDRQGILTVSAVTSNGAPIAMQTIEGPNFSTVVPPLSSPTPLNTSIVAASAQAETSPADQAITAPEVPMNTEIEGATTNTDVEMEDLHAQVVVDPVEHKLKTLLRTCIEEMEENFSNAQLSRPVKLSVRKVLDAAKQFLELQEPSESKLKQMMSKLNVWRPSLNVPLVDVDEV